MSIFIQEVLGLLKRNQKKIILDKNKDWFEFGKLYQTSNLNTGAAYNPKMEPFVIKWGDIVCQVTEDMTRTLPGEGKLGYVPVYTDPSGFCSWDTLKDSIITQNALNTVITIGGNLTVTGTSNLNGNVNLGDAITDIIRLYGILLDNSLNPAGANQVLIGQADGSAFWTSPPWITSFTVAGDTVGTFNITQGNTLSILGGTGINTALSAIDTVTINHDDYGTAGTYAFPSSITTNAQGHITSITAGTGSGVTQIIAGTNITISPTGGTGVVTINSIASAAITASNGLTMSTATNVILGGALGQNTTITSSGFSLTAANNTAVTAFTGQNLSSGKGILGTSVSGVGVTGTSETFRAGQFSISPLSDNTVAENTIFQRSVALNAPANDGIGQSLVFENAIKNGSLASANTLISKFTSTGVSARTSEFSITGVNAGVIGDKLILSGNGTLRLPDYGVGNKPGTTTYNLSVTSTGQVIETPPMNYAPRVYVSMLTQTGSVDPPSTIVIFDNITSGSVTLSWSRISAGLYELACSQPLFSSSAGSKSAIFATPDIASRPYFISLERVASDATKMRLNCFNPSTGNSEDDLLDKATFKIELYD